MVRKTNNGESAKAVINELLADSKRRLSRSWHHVATRMAGDYEAPEAWRQLGGDLDTVLKVLDMAKQSLEAAQKEVARPPASHEAADIETVIEKARQLKRAVRASTLPADILYFGRFVLSADGMPDVDFDFGWHSISPNLSSRSYSFTFDDVLDWAIELATHHLQGLPLRAIEKRKNAPEVTAFVRHLAWHFGRAFGQEKRGTIGHIASAVFDLKNPMTAKDVENRLRGRPAPFNPLRKRQFHSDEQGGDVTR